MNIQNEFYGQNRQNQHNSYNNHNEQNGKQYVNQNQNINAQSIDYSLINPKSFGHKEKTQFINQNIYHSGFGDYKICPTNPSVRFPYRNSYNPGTINNICKVMVHNYHQLDVANNLCDHGLDSLAAQTMIPAVMYPIGKEFTGSNFESREGIYDENIILRTNYSCVIKRQDNLFLQNNDGQKVVVYSKPITIIRNSNYDPLPYSGVFKVAIITVCYDRKYDLIPPNITKSEKDSKKNKEKNKEKDDEQRDQGENILLTSNDLLSFQMYIEAVFQAAICGQNNILLLTFFGREFGIPIDDQILIYNMCIMKFGHKFQGIMICIPPYEGKDLYEYFEKNIIKPNSCVQDIEMKFQADEMAQAIIDNNENNDDNPDEKNNALLLKNLSTMNEKDKMKTLKKIVKNNKSSKNKSESVLKSDKKSSAKSKKMSNERVK